MWQLYFFNILENIHFTALILSAVLGLLIFSTCIYGAITPTDKDALKYSLIGLAISITFYILTPAHIKSDMFYKQLRDNENLTKENVELKSRLLDVGVSNFEIR